MKKSSFEQFGVHRYGDNVRGWRSEMPLVHPVGDERENAKLASQVPVQC